MIELGVLTPAGWMLVAQVVDGKLVIPEVPADAPADPLPADAAQG